MGATAEEYQGFQRAVAKALAKEREKLKEREPKERVEYIATFTIGGKVRSVKNTDFAVFEGIVMGYSRSFPNIPINLFSYTEMR
jgi:hypothetical protein